MKTKHTPGPWDLLPLAACQAIQAGPRNRICVLYNHVEHDGIPCGSIESQSKAQDEIDANAWLIAAAPDLLKACRAALGVMEQHGHTHDNPTADTPIDMHDTGLSSSLSDVLRAAIAKAEGR